MFNLCEHVCGSMTVSNESPDLCAFFFFFSPNYR